MADDLRALSGIPPEALARVRACLAAQDPAAALASAAALARGERRPRDAAALLLCADLHRQGWSLTVRDALEVCPPAALTSDAGGPAAAKARVRAGLEAMRAVDLSEPTTRAFLLDAGRRRVVAGRRASVLDVIDRGDSLASSLARAGALQGAPRLRALAASIAPYVQVADEGSRCETSGLPLHSLWRYLRLTWALPYRSTPGRTMPFLIRNSARPGHPVMGIGALASPVAQLGRRDAWIGWTLEALLAALARTPLLWSGVLAACRSTLAQALSELTTDDLLDGVRDPTSAEGLAYLRALSARAAADRQRALVARAVGSRGARARSEEIERLLYLRKRADLAADLLAAQARLATAPLEGSDALAALQSDATLDRALRVALRELRKRGLASRVLDLSVCGAIAPYGGLLVGKLVALSVASSELWRAYQARYGQHVSEIASKMAGRPIVRPAEYAVVTTMSLYGAGASQYNRLALEVPTPAGRRHLRWVDLGLTEGFGTVHLSDQTVEALAQIPVEGWGAARNVNNRFGEGTSARLRRIREGLQALGITRPDDVLRHAAPRRVYGFEVSAGAREALLLGQPVQTSLPTLEEVAAAWATRWLNSRINSPEALARVRSEGPHTVQARLRPQGGAQLDLLTDTAGD